MLSFWCFLVLKRSDFDKVLTVKCQGVSFSLHDPLLLLSWCNNYCEAKKPGLPVLALELKLEYASLRSCSIETNWVVLVVVSTWSIGNQPFSVGLVDQLFQPTRKLGWNGWKRWVSTAVTIVGSYPLSNKRHLVYTVVVWCPVSPGIRLCLEGTKYCNNGYDQKNEPKLFLPSGVHR